MGKLWILHDSTSGKQSKPLTVIQMQKVLLHVKIKDLQKYLIWTPGWKEWQKLDTFMNSNQKIFVFAPAPAKIEERNAETAQNSSNNTSSTMTTTHMTDNDTEATAVVDNSGYENDITEILTEISNNDMTVATNPDGKPVDYGYFFNDFKAEDLNINAKLKSNLSDNNKRRPQNYERRQGDRFNYRIEIILISKLGKVFRSYSSNISISGTLLENEIPKDFLNDEFEIMLVNSFEKNIKRNKLFIYGKIVGDIKNPFRLTFMDVPPDIQLALKELLSAYTASLPQKAS